MVTTARIANVLAAKGAFVATVPGGTTIGEALSELARRSIGALVVSDDAVSIDGIVSERDIVRALAEQAAGELMGQPVRSIMSSPVYTCRPDDAIDAVMAIMTIRRVRHVPVVTEGTMCGLVSIGDVVKSRIQQLEDDHRVLVDYISAR